MDDYMIGCDDDPGEYARGLDREKMLEEAEAKLVELLGGN